MDLNQLKTFVTVAEQKHLTRAAEQLFTSQPAISAQLKALEEALNITLFERTPKGMQLTPGGERLLEYARKTLALTQDMMTEAKALRGKILGTLKIGLNSDLPFLRIPELLAELNRQHPELKLSLSNSMSWQIIEDVRKGHLDSGFFFGPHSGVGLHSLELAMIETAVVAPSAWADSIIDASIDELATLPWIYTTQRCPFYLLKQQLFHEHAQPPENKTVFVDTEENIRALIKAGAGISLLRDDDAARAEREGWGVRWNGTTPHFPLSVCVPSNRQQEPEIQAWLTALIDCWQVKLENVDRDVI